MKHTVFVILLTFAIALLGASTSLELRLDTPQINYSTDFCSVTLPGAQIYGQPGEPALPWLGTKILLPLGEEATSISIKRSGVQTIKLEKPLQPIQRQYPFSRQDLPPMLGPDQQIYSSAAAWPQMIHNGTNTQFLAGHPINFSAVCPFEYYPLTNELLWYKSIQISVESAPSPRAIDALKLLKQESYIQERLAKAIDNQDNLPRYDTRTSGVEYLIICDFSKLSQWAPLQDFYTQRGMNVMLQTVQQISGQAGQDLQEKIRNYIIQMYQTNPLRHVLLAGDTDVIPHRGFYVNFGTGEQTDTDIPADMYYSCLDGNWNTDGDNYWGEPYESDLAPELDVGRICYNSDAEISNQINKILMYHVVPVEAETKSAFFVGEWLWEGPTWGGDYMDEMIGGSSMHGYTTVGVPTSWNISTLYDRTYGYQEAWGPNQVRPMLSQGANLVNHLGHSNTTYVMRLNNNQATSTTITNNGSNHNFSIYFSQGCYAGAFDNRTTSPGQYTSDSITEKLTALPTAAVAMISNSRYGWGMQGSTNGASQYIHRQYMDAIFGENIHELGHTLTDAKIDNIPYITNNGVMYWVTYETNLIGDPALSIWTDTPQQLTADMPPMWSMSQLSYQIPTNAPFCKLRLKSGSSILFEGTANANGMVIVQFLSGLAPGNYEIFITAPNYYPYYAPITVQASQMPYVVANNVIHNDADGLLHTGEDLFLSLTLKNIGSINQNGQGTVTLSCSSQNIQILSGSPLTFNAIAAGDSITLSNAFQIGIRGCFADGVNVTLNFSVSFDGYTSSSSRILRLNAPALSVRSYQLLNPNPEIYPGDNPAVSFTIKNTGSGNAQTPFMILFSDHPQVNLSHFEANLPPVPAGQEILAPAVFSAQIPPDMDINTDITISYVLSAENGDSVEGSLVIHLGALIYDFENNEMGWTSSAPNPSFTNQWHRSSYRNHTSGGGFSMKFGGQGSSSYANSSFGALDSPEFALGKNSQLKFYHRMNAEVHNNPIYGWDGGLVQMSLNGGAWTQIAPVGGYSHRIYQNNASPFTANTNCWSGSFNWREETFDLAQYSGMIRFRFLFGADAYTNAEGWYIDDVRMESEYVSGDDPAMMPTVLALEANYPNPFNPSTSISFSLPKADTVELSIYNLRGQRIRTLVSGAMNAGKHRVVFDGKDENGRNISSGVYLYKLRCGSAILTRKMMLMK